MTASTVEPRDADRGRRATIAGGAVFLLLAAALLLWAKWWPYAARLPSLSSAHRWAGRSILGSARIAAGSSPSWSAAWSFTVAYGLAVWKALVAALVVAAALQSLIPRGRLVRLLSRRRRVTSAVAGGFASLPSMMCTCCTAPVAVSLRGCGVPTSAVLAYWMGNPLLNPAVLVFLALVAPWQWVVTRVLVGGLLVVIGSTVVARFAKRPQDVQGMHGDPESMPDDASFRLSLAPARFARALARLVLVLVPEYFVAVLLVGAFAGWLFPLGTGSAREPLATAAAVTLGTLLVIPTGGEIALAQGLTVAGFGLGVAGALLVTLPAVSLPSLVMVGRALSWRVTLAAASAVVLAGTFAALLLPALA